MPLLRPLLSVLAAFGLAACVVGQAPAPVPTGAQDFADYCASCHGLTGKGDGDMASRIARAPADLTLLAKRNDGDFPTTRVMAKIWGYTGARDGAVMPNFGPLLDSETIPYDGGDGILTPTPVRLVQIAEHLKTLQAR